MNTGIVSRDEFALWFTKTLGTAPGGAAVFCCHYERASAAAEKALPHVPDFGWFTSNREKIRVFLLVCGVYNLCRDEGLVDDTETLAAIFLLAASNASFLAALKAFGHFARGKSLGGRHLSYTAWLFAHTLEP